MTNDRTTRYSAPLRPLDIALIVLTTMVVVGAAWLLSAPETTKLMEGAIPWHEESPLRAVVQLLCLNYAFPTVSPGAVKMYILGLGAGLAVLALVVAAVVRSRADDNGASAASGLVTCPEEECGHQNASDEEFCTACGAALEPTSQRIGLKRQVAPLTAAQLLIGLYLLWSFASGRWSSAPELSVGGSILLSIQFLWAFALGLGLCVRAARILTRIIVVITGITATVALWYFFGRNPGLRAMFPFGNPIFLATCLIPGLLLSLTWLFDAALRGRAGLNAKESAVLVAIVVTHLIAGWAFFLADSRGPALGLLFGLIALAFFAVRGRWRLAPVGVALLVTVGAWLFFAQTQNNYSRTGRSATIRLREYAWSYAWRMFLERPFTGEGQGAYVLKGDSYAVNDVLNDPQVFENRIDHAHNEWLEVLADLGAVGLVLLLAGLCITMRAATLVIDGCAQPETRWALVGLSASLVALMVTETFSVGLRVSGVPTFFFTTLGLCWAMSSQRRVSVVDRLGATRGRRVMTGVVGGVLGAALLVVSQADWTAARDEFQAEVAFADARNDEAVEAAARAVTRLSPQRALRSLARLGDAHLRAALDAQQRAADREQRATATEPPNLRLAMLALGDYDAGEQHCLGGTHALKELVSRSPGFINSGLIEYQLNLARARNAEGYARLAKVLPADAMGAARPDALAGAREQFIQNALRAIEREMLRQPFNTTVATEYARIGQGMVEFGKLLDALARPLRQGRITPAYVDVLGSLLSDPSNDATLTALATQAREAITVAAPTGESGEPVEIWAPERLRIDAMVRFLRGDYAGAAESLSIALTGYEAIADQAALATASCLAESADARFFADPLHPEPALASADRALGRVPSGLRGGELAVAIKRRMVDYNLAGDREQQAVSLLRESAPAGASEEAVQVELASRYRRLCESMLARRGDVAQEDPVVTSGLMGPPAPVPTSYIAPNLLSALSHWIDRAVELDPVDPDVWRVAAAVDLERGDPAGAVQRIRNGIENGLSDDIVAAFLQAASAQFPDDPIVQGFRAEKRGEPTAPGAEPPD